MPTDPQYPTWEQSNKVANLFASVIDQPNQEAGYSNPTYGSRSPFNLTFREIMGQDFPGYSQNIGILQNPPQYRGIRMTLPMSRGGYEATNYTNPMAKALQQMVYGELIRRGYPIYGGTGPFLRDTGYSKDFNPIGFGQR